MKTNKKVWLAFALLVLVASVYRVWSGRPFGFAPQIAMAIFSGAVIKDKKVAFILPLLSMFLSDALYQVLYIKGLTSIPGFYEGQVTNYILIGLLTFFGLWVKTVNWTRIVIASLAAPTFYFLVSNFLVWNGGGGYQHPHTFSGLLLSYADGIPFYGMSIIATLFFSVLLFGSYSLVQQKALPEKTQLTS